MPATDTRMRRKAVFEGDRALRRTVRRFGEDFRALRVRLGTSQAAVASSIGVARSVICRLESGDEDVGPRIRARACAALGATYKMALYPDAEPMIRDAAHARLIETLLRLRHPGWRVTVEATLPDTYPGSARRSTDVRLDGARQIVLFEIETRIERWEELAWEAHDKHAAVRDANLGRHRRLRRPGPPADPPESGGHSLPSGHRARGVPRGQQVAPRRTHESARPWPGDGILWLPADRS